MAEDEADVRDVGQVTLKFTTKLPAQYRVPETPVTVPANLTRYGLSQIINHLLSLDPTRPFDFLVQGELLRLNLHAHLTSKALSTEATLQVEYVPAVLPPSPKEKHIHDDWVACVVPFNASSSSRGPTKKATKIDGPGNHVVACGCYDGYVRLWHGGQQISSFEAHQGPIKGVSVVPLHSSQMVTVGEDSHGRVWSFPASQIDKNYALPDLVAVLKGHEAAVECVSVSPDGQRCATGAWDRKVLLWRVGEELESAHPASKRRKTAKTTNINQAQAEEAPLGALEGHTDSVSTLAWPAPDLLVTGSWDHTLRVWDPSVAACLDTYAHNKAIYCLATPSSSIADADLNVVVFGGPEKVIRVWDRRMDNRSNKSESLAVHALASHTDWVSALAWHPSSANHFVSASFDGTAKLWDLRAAVPLHTLTGGDEKLLCAAWAGPGTVAMGGADCMLRTSTVDLHL